MEAFARLLSPPLSITFPLSISFCPWNRNVPFVRSAGVGLKNATEMPTRPTRSGHVISINGAVFVDSYKVVSTHSSCRLPSLLPETEGCSCCSLGIRKIRSCSQWFTQTSVPNRCRENAKEAAEWLMERGKCPGVSSSCSSTTIRYVWIVTSRIRCLRRSETNGRIFFREWMLSPKTSHRESTGIPYTARPIEYYGLQLAIPTGSPSFQRRLSSNR